MKTKKIVSIILAVTLVMSSGFIVTPAKEATAASVTPIGEIKSGETKTFTHPGGGIAAKWGTSYENCLPIVFKPDAGEYVYRTISSGIRRPLRMVFTQNASLIKKHQRPLQLKLYKP